MAMASQAASSPKVGSATAGGAAGATKGAISQLQEFVQGAKLYPMPPNCAVLQWSYDTRMVGGRGSEASVLEFRATVAFLLDGVPHHAVGSWKHSKKIAQRDTAERSLGLLVNRWGEIAMQEIYGLLTEDGPTGTQPIGLQPTPRSLDPIGEPEQEPPALCAPGSGVASAAALGGEAAKLFEYCNKFLPSHEASAHPPRWHHKWDAGRCQAFVVISMFGVPHTFPGRFCDSQEAACSDAARRALWYLNCPGYENLFEPDPEYVKAAAQTIPEASPSWQRDGHADEGEEQQLAERKTMVMRVQNRLQQAYAQQLKAGTPVWFWSYDRSPRDRGWPPLFRASVHVPLAGKTFRGGWTRGQREAQIEACGKIGEFLDGEFPRTRPAAAAV